MCRNSILIHDEQATKKYIIENNRIFVNFFVVYVKNPKKFQKYVKLNSIKNKYILDIKKISQEEDIDLTGDNRYLKIIVLNKIQQAISKNKDIYYIPDFDSEFSIEKLMNLRKLLKENNFNVLVFYNEFIKDGLILDDVMENLSEFSNSQILMDY